MDVVAPRSLRRSRRFSTFAVALCSAALVGVLDVGSARADYDSVEAASLTLDLSALSTKHTDRDGSTTGFTVATSYAGYVGTERFSARGVQWLAIGGGTGGVQGGLLGDLALGARVPLARFDGIVFRGGLRGWYEGNDTLLWSLFELPQLQVAYQHLGTGVLEVGARTGAVLAGRYNPGLGGAVRRLGTTGEIGGYLSILGSVLRADLSLMQVVPSPSDPSPGGLTVLDGKLCGVIIGAVVLCGDARWMEGAVSISPTDFPTATTTMFGLSIGLTRERRH